MSTASILARLSRLEKALHLEEIEAYPSVAPQLDLIAGRRRETAGYRPCGVPLAVLIEKARAAALQPRFT